MPKCLICLADDSGCEQFGCWMNQKQEKYMLTFTCMYMDTKEKIIDAYSDYDAIDQAQHMIDTQDDLQHYSVTSVVKM